MRIFIFDDEEYFLNNLKNEISDRAERNMKELPELRTVRSMQGISDEKLYDDDVFFLDIADGENENAGLRLAHEIRKRNVNAHIIFVTSHYEKIRDAVGGLIRPSEFLVKPLCGAEKEKLYMLLDSLFSTASKECVTVKIGHDNINIPLNEILCISRDMRKTVIVTGSRRYMIREAFTSLTERLGDKFIIADKGVAVNISKIDSWNQNSRILTIGDNEIYYSRERSKKIRQLMMERGIPNE